MVSDGKIHFPSTDDDCGFTESIVPMNVFERTGDLYGLLRGDDMPARADGKKLAGLAGPGESEYTWYDREIASRAQIWLREQAPKHRNKPWVMFVSFVAPHFPLTAPPHWYYKYPFDKIPMPKLYRDRNEYVNRIRVAARELEQAGFLLPEDSAIIIQAAASSPAFGGAASGSRQ